MVRSWQQWRDHYQDRLMEQAIGGKATSPLRRAYGPPPVDVSPTSPSVCPAVDAAESVERAWRGAGGDHVFILTSRRTIEMNHLQFGEGDPKKASRAHALL